MHTMDAAQLAALISKPKTAVNWTGWAQLTSHANHMAGVCELMDDEGIVIPRITLECRIRAGAIVESCYYVFSLMELSGHRRRRVFQLEVYPSSHRSHNGLTVLYGPHLHRLEDEPTAIQDPAVNCGSWATCLLWFLGQAGISNHNIQTPDTP